MAGKRVYWVAVGVLLVALYALNRDALPPTTCQSQARYSSKLSVPYTSRVIGCRIDKNLGGMAVEIALALDSAAYEKAVSQARKLSFQRLDTLTQSTYPFMRPYLGHRGWYFTKTIGRDGLRVIMLADSMRWLLVQDIE